jgi:hypothetical protein
MPSGLRDENRATQRKLTEYGHATLSGRLLDGSIKPREAAECAPA